MMHSWAKKYSNVGLVPGIARRLTHDSMELF